MNLDRRRLSRRLVRRSAEREGGSPEGAKADGKVVYICNHAAGFARATLEFGERVVHPWRQRVGRCDAAGRMRIVDRHLNSAAIAACEREFTCHQSGSAGRPQPNRVRGSAARHGACLYRGHRHHAPVTHREFLPRCRHTDRVLEFDPQRRPCCGAFGHHRLPEPIERATIVIAVSPCIHRRRNDNAAAASRRDHYGTCRTCCTRCTPLHPPREVPTPSAIRHSAVPRKAAPTIHL